MNLPNSKHVSKVRDALRPPPVKRLCGLVLPACALAALAGCAGSPSPSVAITESVASSEHRAALSQGADYRLGSGDKIKLTVFGEDEMSGDFEIGSQGTLSLPLIGQIQAGGMTVPEFEQRLTQQLGAYIRRPRVSIQVLNYRPFYIQGEVKTAGEYSYSNGLLVRDAIAKAGGYTYRAATGHVFIRRANEQEERRYPLDIPVYVMPGDNIRVDERFF